MRLICGVVFLLRPDIPVQALDLVLAGLYRQPRDVVVLGKGAQFREADRLIGPRRENRIVANREIPDPNLLLFGRGQRVIGRENPA
jgi:hypothetical protein